MSTGRMPMFSINLSGQSLGDDDILEFIEDELGIVTYRRRRCVSKLPSRPLSQTSTRRRPLSTVCRELGCSISLDDFGAGLSSFAYLKSFNVDTLKIDGGFIRDITENRISESMVAAITQVAKVMELQTVAEYVETEEQRELLVGLGVDYAQGHIIGRPQAIESVLAGLTDQLKALTG